MRELPLIDQSCELTPDALEGRLEQWRQALAGVTAVDRTSRAAGRVVLDLGPTVDLGEVARLCGLEVQCCSFFAFSLAVSSEGRSLVVTVPSGAVQALDELLQVLPELS